MANIAARGADAQQVRGLERADPGHQQRQPFALKTQADSLKLTYPLLSDRPPRTIERYGVMAPDKVRALRAYFLIDQQGIVRKQWLLGIAGDDIVFSSEPILKAVQELQGKQ